MQSKIKYLNENTIGILAIIGTLVISHIVAFPMKGEIIPDFIKPASVTWYVLPGIISFIAYALLTKNLFKAVIVGILTNVFWFIWFIVYIIANYEMY